MTEDEAFIRAVVATPGDDTPRLAYADWLDDRSDPRGAYLRAEHEWAATHDPGDRETLRQMAKGLDPVWVARVSRPPIGVCLGVNNVIEHGPPATDTDLNTFEERLNVKLPPAYRGYQLNYNGGILQSIWGTVGGEMIPAGNPLTLYPIIAASIEQPDLLRVANWYRELLTIPSAYLHGQTDPAIAAAYNSLLPVGYVEGYRVFIWVDGPKIGTACEGDILGTDLPDPVELVEHTVEGTFSDYLAKFLG